MKHHFIHIAAEAGLESADIIDHLVNGVFVVGIDTRFHYINKPVLNKFMMTDDELRSRSFLDFVHPEDREYAHAVFQSLLAGENISPFIIRYDINGQCGMTEIRARALMGAKGLAGVIATAHDVREKQATDFDCISFIELLPIPLGIFSIDGIVEYFNPAFVNLFGYSLEDVRTFDEWFSKAYPDEQMRAQLRSEWDADLAAMQPGSIAQKTLEVAWND
jgi:PAS domain S-box-containing protein